MEQKKVWLITGSGSGLGRSITVAALKAGDLVVATARNPKQLEDLSVQYRDQIFTVALDVDNEEQAKHAVQSALGHFGHIDVLVNNAGYGDKRPFEQVPAEDFRKLIETCFFGVVTLTREVLPSMRRRRSGHIINISSIGGRMGTPGNAAYHAAKWAVGGFTESLALETASFNVQVTALEPGGIRTNWGRRAYNGAFKLLPEYEASVGATIKALEHYWGNENSDPDKIAQIVLKVAVAEQLPAHILLGSDAWHFVGEAGKRRRQEEEQWKLVTESADFENKTALPEINVG
jgi:NAD(P)-dependent dehydrogenase (short-subunit alcohol dehydrogenase family)